MFFSYLNSFFYCIIVAKKSILVMLDPPAASMKVNKFDFRPTIGSSIEILSAPVEPAKVVDGIVQGISVDVVDLKVRVVFAIGEGSNNPTAGVALLVEHDYPATIPVTPSESTRGGGSVVTLPDPRQPRRTEGIDLKPLGRLRNVYRITFHGRRGSSRYSRFGLSQFDLL